MAENPVGMGPTPVQKRNPMQMQQVLTAQLMQSQEAQSLKFFTSQMSDYYDNPKSFSNEDMNALQKQASAYGVNIDLAATDKATAMEHIGAATVGVLDGVLFDLIPDDLYSSRRTETARAIGNWAGIIVPAVITTIGTMGAGAPVVGAALAKIGLKGGAKKAAMKLGSKEGLNALRMSEKNLARVSKALSVTPGGIVGRYVPQAVMGAGQALSKFGLTKNVGEKILRSRLGKTGAKEQAKDIAKKVSRFAKKGDTEGMTDALSKVGSEYAPYMGSAVDDLVKSGKVKGVAADVLKQATSKFGKTNFSKESLDGVAKGFMGYKKTSKVARGHAENVMEGLRKGLKNNKSIDDIVKEAKIPKSRGDAIKKMWSNPETRSDMLKELAKNTPESDSTIMSALGNLAMPAGIAALETGVMGSSEGMDEIDNASPF